MEDPTRARELIGEVAAVLQRQNYEVLIEPDLEGLQVDVFARRGKGKGTERIVVECKAYTKLVGLKCQDIVYIRMCQDIVYRVW